MTHVGPVHHPPVAEAEGEPFSLALDAHAPVVQDVVVDAADRDEVLLGVVASGAETLDVMQVQPEAIAAAGHLASVVITVHHGASGGGGDHARDVTPLLPRAHLHHLRIAEGLTHAGRGHLGFWSGGVLAAGAVLDDDPEPLTRGHLRVVQVRKNP